MNKRLINIIGLVLLLLSPVLSHAQATQINYQYWIDNNKDAAVSGTTTDGAALNLSVDVANLSSGIHFLNMRARKGKEWGTVYRKLFAIPRAANAASSQLARYEYWTDNDYAHRVSKTVSGSEGTVVGVSDLSSLSPGIHFFNMRVQGNDGAWGSVKRQIFSIPREQQASVDKQITGYRYGFDGSMTTVTLPSPVSEYTLTQAFDAPDPPLPATIDDDCHFSFSGTTATLMRNVEMTFALNFTDESNAMSSPVGTTFTVTDMRTTDILSLSVPGSQTVPDHTTGGYTVMKFDIATSGSYSIKSSSACSLRLYSSTGAQLCTVESEALTAGYSQEYESGTYYAVAYGNTANTTLTINVSDANLLKPTLTYADDAVTISSSLDGATFYYTLDGSDPTTASIRYETPIPVDRNLTVKAIASWAGIGTSPIASLTIDIFSVVKPVITHEGNVVTITTTTEGATIHYTTDGSDPTAESTAYTEPFTVTKNCTIKVIALRDGYHDSEVETFVVDWLRVADVTFTQDGSKLTLATTTEGATIMYKVASEDYSSEGEWTVYNGVLNLEGSYHVEAYATKDGYYDSWITECLFIYFRPTVSAPQITHDEDLISITCGTEEATIYYTMDGSDPTTESTVYTESFTVTENCTIKAFAVKNGFIDSEITSLTVDWIVPDGVCGYAELNSETGTLTFKYGIMPEGENVWNTDDTKFDRRALNKWSSNQLKNVVFDPSYAKARPKSTAYWFYGAKELANITGIEFLNTSNVTDMGWMFSMCSGLTSLDVTHFDTGNVTDMSYMFSSCVKLTSLDIRNFNTANVTSMGSMFSGCSGLTSLDLSNFDTGNVTQMAYMFHHSRSLTELDLRNFNTTNVTIMQEMFSSCNSLTGLDISQFDTGNVTTMNSMFAYCRSLTSLDVSHFSTGNVTDMHRMFFGCSGLTSLDLSNFDTGNVTLMSSMFSGCSSLTSLDLSNFDTGNVTTMNSMFAYCRSLTSLDLRNFDTGNVTQMAYMFHHSSSLTELDLRNFNTTNVTIMQEMFSSCNSLTGLDISQFDTGNVTTMNSMFAYCRSLTSLDVSHFSTGNVTDMHRMFFGCSGLTSLDLSNFDTGNVTLMSSMFSGCSSLTNLDVSHFNTGNVTAMNSMFSGCSSLTNLDVSHFNTGNVTTMNYMFSGCSSLTNLDVSHFDTGNVTKMNDMFSHCSGLTRLDVSHFDTKNVTGMTNMFAMCYSLKDLDVSHFDTGNVGDMSCMFYCCNEVGNLDVSHFNTEKVTDMSFMFAGCSSLTSLDVSSFKTSKVTRMDAMFQYCMNLPSLDVSNFDTNNVTNMMSMFSHCPALTSLDVSNFNTANVTDMNCMFELCTGLPKLNLSNFDTGKVTDMNRMFYLCNGLESLNVDNFNTTNVKDMRFMFSHCNSLKSLNLSSFDTSSVTAMDSLFSCSGEFHLLYWYKTNLGYRSPSASWSVTSSQLSTIYASDTWNTTNVTSSDNMFCGCLKLVGGSGTSFSSYNDGIAYARIDGGASAPGYFTLYVRGDLNGDGKVDSADFDLLADCILNRQPADMDRMLADINGDQVVNAVDLVALANLTKYGQITPPVAGARKMTASEPTEQSDAEASAHQAQSVIVVESADSTETVSQKEYYYIPMQE